MHYSFNTSGTCAVNITFDIDNNIVSNIVFIGGCNGNLKMISKLLEGKTTDYIISMCLNNKCGYKNTSCADQLAKAVQKAIAK